ncbi:MAG: hypothetical protein WC933_03820 [Candidatus Paceibacterota bacterium]|jgi:hypothetical protein
MQQNKEGIVVNSPIYKIHGAERREKKNELAKAKSFVKHFWFCEGVCRDHGGGMENEQCNKVLNEFREKIERLETELAEKA